MQGTEKLSVVEMKSMLIRKIGPDRSKQYFDNLNRFLSLKLSKTEFNKLCVRTVGRDGIPLHNQLIRLILKNACGEKNVVGNKQQNGVQVVNEGLSPLVFANGDVLSVSPRKARSGRGWERKSGHGPNGITNYRPVQHHQEVVKRVENVEESLGQKYGRSLLHAPLGIPYCSVSIGGARKTPSLPSSSKSIGVSDINSLLETTTLRTRMEHVASTQGIEVVSVDCTNALNNGLDAYLKGILRSCLQLNRSISLLDFRVAIDLNPRQLSEDWPIQLEKICTCSFEENDRSL